MPAPLRPPPYATDRRSLERTARVEVYTASGPGGQHRNKTQSGVRLHHPDSGLIISATERRSQAANIEAAFERLAARLAILNHVPDKRHPTKPTRGSRERRLTAKSHERKKKQLRRRPPED